MYPFGSRGFRSRYPPYLPQNEIGENAMRRMYTNIIRMDKGVERFWTNWKTACWIKP